MTESVLEVRNLTKIYRQRRAGIRRHPGRNRSRVFFWTFAICRLPRGTG